MLTLGAALVVSVVGSPPASADENAVIDRALGVMGQAPLSQVDADGVVSVKGITVSGDENSVARSTDDGVQVITVVEQGDQARYRLNLPPRAMVSDGPDGSLLVHETTLDGGRLVAVIEAPWAVDATGKKLPTTYSLHGGTLVQHIDTTGATYPVVADPQVSWGWDWPWGPIWKVRFSKGNVQDIIEGHYFWAATAILGMVCGVIMPVNYQAGVACGLIGGLYAESIADSFRAAFNRSPNNCVYMKFTHSGIPLEWYRYNCDGSTY